jgi:demethylmenaquinone methyltransferase/2-methoxy-6-polyprenyl-1,4-benzoquinol methylase
MREMFGRIAPKYDFITRVFSYGMDRRWKRLAVDRSPLPGSTRVLDLACGTGDFYKLVAKQDPGAQIVAADLTEPMLRVASLPNSVCADASYLPFADASFDAVYIGYGLRNFPNLEQALSEVRRTLKPGGALVSLDFFLPDSLLLRRAYLTYLYVQGGFWGVALHGRARVYTYIPDSLRTFLSAREFSSLLQNSGFAEVSARPFILGGIAVHWAKKSP